MRLARQPVLVRAIKIEMASQKFGVRVDLIETMRSRKDIHTSDQILQSLQRRMMNPKAGREEKKRKIDHQPFQPFRQTTLQPKSSRSGHCLQPGLRRSQGRGRAAMAAFPDPSGCAALCKITGDNGGSFPGKH